MAGLREGSLKQKYVTKQFLKYRHQNIASFTGSSRVGMGAGCGT